MDHTVQVEGNILLEDEDDESSVSSEESQPAHSTSQFTSTQNNYDDEEEEIEVFDGSNRNPSNANKPIENVEPTVADNRLAAAISSSAHASNIEHSNPTEDEFGVRYENRNYPAWFDKHNPVTVAVPAASVVYATDAPNESLNNNSNKYEDEDDEFAVIDNRPNSSDTPLTGSSVLQALENIKKIDSRDDSDINFEKELSEYAHNYGANAKNQELNEKVLQNNKLYTNTFNIFAGDKLNAQGSMLSDEPLVILDSQPMDHTLPEDLPHYPVDRSKIEEESFTNKTFMQESKKALAEIVEVYGQGMGDQEVLLLDLMQEEEESQGKLSLKKNKGNGKENEIRATQKIFIDKTLNAITEEDEEEEDNDENDEEEEVVVRQPGQRRAQPPSKVSEPPSALEEEWNAIVIDQNNTQNNKVAATSSKLQQTSDVTSSIDINFEDSNQDYEKWTYEALTSYLNTLNLSTYEPHIVISEKNPNQSKGFLKSMFSSSSSSSVSSLQFPNAETSLKFPFLLAQIDYDPFDIKHLNLLRTIYYALLESSSTSSASHILSPIDEKWENLGFQGKDPRTDLNRAIKLLSLIQMLAFIESNRSLVKYLFEISESAKSLELQTNKKISRNPKEIDYSWPFMCVAILISKEAIQCLRYGDLVELCNKKRNVLEALNLFHHACFAEFGRMLVEDPAKHHAMHLAALREKCAKNPTKILKAYNDNNDLIINSILSNDYYTKLQKPSTAPKAPSTSTRNTSSTSKSKAKEEVIESFDKFEEISDDPSYFNREAEKEISKSKNAKRFMAIEVFPINNFNIFYEGIFYNHKSFAIQANSLTIVMMQVFVISLILLLPFTLAVSKEEAVDFSLEDDVFMGEEILQLFSKSASSKDLKIVPADQDVGKDMVTLVTERGYSIETHYVTTSDGYILTVFNIPYGKNSESSSRNKYPVILQHGLLDSSYSWITNFEDQSLGYLLADAGFDVWFGNNRGNRYGRNHTKLNPDDGTDAFWKFTWDEMAAYDLPAIINYVNDKTKSQVSWIGHSEGTIQMFAAGTITGSSKSVSKALEKLDLFVALAPVAYVHHLKSKDLSILAHTRIVDRFLKNGVYEFLPYGGLTNVLPQICRLTPEVCHIFMRTLFGPSRNLNDSRLQVYVSQTPAGTSVYNMDHWIQGVRRNNFQMYDYGSIDENMKHYRQRDPPQYELKDFQPKVALFSGSNDFLADPKDVKQLIEELPAEKIVYQDVQDDYAHVDFTWGVNANERIYNKIIELLNPYLSAKK